MRNAAEGLALQREVDKLARRKSRRERRFAVRGQGLLGLARLAVQQTGVARLEQRKPCLLEHPAKHAVIEIVATERRIAVGREHLEHAARQPQDRNVEGSSAEVEYGINAFGRVVQTVGDGGRRRLVQQAQHIQPGDSPRILGRLALRIVEVRRNGNHRAAQLAAERSLGPSAQGFQDFCRDLDRALHAGRGTQLHHAGRVDEVVGRVFDVVDIAQAATHEALDRDNRVLRIDRLMRLRGVADLAAAVSAVAHNRRQQHAPALVGQGHGDAVAHRRDKGVGRAQIDAHGEAMLVRRR